MEFRTGDIILIKRPVKKGSFFSFLAKTIRNVAGIEYNHAGCINVVNKDVILYESREDGFHSILLSKRLEDKDYTEKFIVYRPTYNLDPVNYIHSLNYISGIEYDVRGLVFEQLLWNKWNIWRGAKTEKEALKRLFCYEAVFYCHRYSTTFEGEWWKYKPSRIIENPFKEFEIVS